MSQSLQVINKMALNPNKGQFSHIFITIAALFLSVMGEASEEMLDYLLRSEATRAYHVVLLNKNAMLIQI